MKKYDFSYLIKKYPQYFIIKNLEKDETIFHEDEVCLSIALVIKGIIKISSYTIYGNEIIYSIVNENEFFGNNLLFSLKSTYRGEVICLDKVTIAFILKDDFLNLLSREKDFLNAYLSLQSEQIKKLNFKIKLLSLESAEERFLYYLSSNNNIITFKSITYLSYDLSLRRETVSRLIKKLSDEKIITRNKNQIIKIN